MKTPQGNYHRFPAWMLKEMQPQKGYKELVLESYGRKKGLRMLKATTQSGRDAKFNAIKVDQNVWDNSVKVGEDLREII